MYPEHYGNNPLFPQKEDFEVILKNDLTGMGVVTYRDFEQGELVAKLAGERIQDVRQHSLQIDKNTHLYDRYFSGYFLHSCDPNVTLDMKELTVHAVRPIRAYEFLYMDYSETEEKLFRQFTCGCGSAQCRGWITGYNDLISEADEMFQNYSKTIKIAI